MTDCVEREKQIREHENYKDQFSMEYATDVCACSVLAADWLFGSKIPRDRIRILPNAVDAGKYRFDPIRRQIIRESLNLEGRIVIGNVGRYSYQKNQEFLIKAFVQAYENNPSLFLLCLGKGEMLKSLKKLINQFHIEDSTLCIEWQTNVEDYLQAMDTFCLPSKFEGLPISAIEAQASGLRCLISDCVTKEVRITKLVKFLPLDEEYWARELEECKIDLDRGSQDDKIARAGYDIRIAAEQLGYLYSR